MKRFVLIAMLAASANAFAGDKECHVVDLEMTPQADLQMVAWVEDANGRFVGTTFITQLTGTYGIGNRPGIKDFNSAWHWPYGRREFVFPVWAHRHGLSFPKVGFQDGAEDNLSHSNEQSSLEHFFCRPIAPEGDPLWDKQTCASRVYTDKGHPIAGTSLYPPRADLQLVDGVDDPAVATYNELNPFDTVSQATPIGGMDFTSSWPMPPDLAPGDYVMFVEVSKEFDFNDVYNATSYPPPTKSNGSPLPWSEYGLPARGQPSIVYRVPFTIGSDQTVATTSDYAGYGDPEGANGELNPPDDTITTAVARLQLTADGKGGTFRLRVTARPEHDSIAPAAPQAMEAVAVDERSATIDFVEPGDDGLIGPVAGFEVRYRAGSTITDGNFFDSIPVAATLQPRGPGAAQAVTVSSLLPETDYFIGIRAYDECKNYGPLAVVEAKTTDRQGGYVDACFVATAAYGSLLANDVDTLRRFRDRYLESNVLGELAVETYYSVGPAVAGVVDQSEELRGVAREGLAPIVHFIRTMSSR